MVRLPGEERAGTNTTQVGYVDVERIDLSVGIGVELRTAIGEISRKAKQRPRPVRAILGRHAEPKAARLLLECFVQTDRNHPACCDEVGR